MDTNKILNANFLDILFDGRNKEYGAYDLRKSYNKRLATAIVAMGSLLLLLFIGSVLANVLNKNKVGPVEIAQEVKLAEVAPPEKKVELPPPPTPPIQQPPRVEMTQFTPPEIVKDDLVKEDEKPPVVEDLADSKISLVNQEGEKYDDVVAPPVEPGTGNVVAPKQDLQDFEKVFIKVEIPAEFPGGIEGWKRYLERNLQYPEPAVESGREGVVRVQMVVDKGGNISEVQALNDPGDGLAEEAMRIIKRGPKWIPAQQNEQKVAYRFVQSITFRLGN